MRNFLVVVALGIVVATPAFAQTSRHQQQPTYERNNNLNPDRQLSGERWKTNKAKRAKHRAASK